MPRTVHLTTNPAPRSVLAARYEEHIVTVKELAPKVLFRAEEYDRSDTILHTIVVPYIDRNIPERLLREAVQNTYSSHGCFHDYDCCGCRVAFTYGFQRTRRRGVFTFLVSEGRNY